MSKLSKSAVAGPLSDQAQIRLLPVLTLACLATAAICLWKSLVSPGVVAEGVLMGPLLAWAIYQARTARMQAQIVGRINRRLNAQMAEQWQVEQALRSSEARFQAFMDNTPAVAFIKDEAGRYVYVNEPYAQRFGIDRADWLGHTIWDMMPAEVAEVLHQETLHACGSEASVQSFVTVPTPDNPDCRWLTLRFPFTDSAGKRFSGCVAIDVSLQQRAIDHQRETAEKLSALIEASPLAIFSFDRDGSIQGWSRAAEKLFGWREDEVLGCSLPFVPANRQEESRELIARLMHGETFTNVETTRLRRDGSRLEISISSAPLHGADGTVAGAVAVIADISQRRQAEEEIRLARENLEDRVRERTSDLNLVNEWLQDEIVVRQKAEEALRVSEQRYRFLADSMPQIVWTSRPDGIPNYYNQWWHEYTGLTPEQTWQAGWEPAVHPDDREKLWELGRSAHKSGQPHSWEYRVRRADGTFRWHLGRSLPLRDASDEIILWVGTGTDIDDFKQSENALRQAHDDLELRVRERTEELYKEREFLRALLDNLQEGIVACDADGTLTIFNQATRDFHGLPETALPASEWAEHFALFLADGKTPMRTADIPLFRAWQGEIVRQAELVIKPRHGKTRTLLVNGQAIRDAQEKTLGAVVVMHDITERKAIDRMKTEFISVVSHELRTPLTSIRGALGLIAGGIAGEVSPQAGTLIGIAHSNTERLVRLINDILDIEKIESGEMDFPVGPVLLRPLLIQALESLRTYAGQYGVWLHLEEMPEEWVVCAEGDRLMQVLTNLLSNAAKFSPPGETVQVGTERRNGAIRVTVRDCGPGIPAEFQERIFQKFAQADSADTRLRGGTGLGLSICKALVEKFGGQIGFETAACRGTTFYMDLQEYTEESEERSGGDRVHDADTNSSH